MSATDHINTEQLRMFVPAGEIMDQYEPADLVGRRDRGELFHDKLKESVHSGLAASVRSEGVHEPAVIYHHDEQRLRHTDVIPAGPELWEGHHRVVSARATRGADELVPVLHIDQDNFNYNYQSPHVRGPNPNAVRVDVKVGSPRKAF